MTAEEAIKHLKLIVDNEAYADHFQDVCRTAIEALEKQIDAETEECSSDIDLGKDKTIVSQSKLFELINKLAEYEDLEEQGLLLRLPCKVGDTVYAPLPNNEISAWKVRTIDMGASYFDFLLVYAGDDEEFIGERFLLPINDIGENVFLTREEAERKLKEMEG